MNRRFKVKWLFAPLLTCFLEGQDFGVDAEPQSRWLGAVVEYVAEVAVAASAKHLNPVHAVAVVGTGPDVFLVDGLEETGPAGAGIELVVGLEEREATSNTEIGAVHVVIVEPATECGFGASPAQDFVLLRGQNLLPLGLGAHHLILSLGAEGILAGVGLGVLGACDEGERAHQSESGKSKERVLHIDF